MRKYAGVDLCNSIFFFFRKYIYTQKINVTFFLFCLASSPDAEGMYWDGRRIRERKYLNKNFKVWLEIFRQMADEKWLVEFIPSPDSAPQAHKLLLPPVKYCTIFKFIEFQKVYIYDLTSICDGIPFNSPLDRWSTIMVPRASHMTLIVVRKRSL